MSLSTIGMAQTPDSIQSTEPARPDGPWLAYRGDLFSIVFAAGVLLDVTGFEQDETSITQVGDLKRDERGEVRGIRIGVAGTINFKRPWTYLMAGAYRAFDVGFDTDTTASFFVFDLALGIPVGPLGVMTVGKMKEPFSLERVMSLAFEHFMERPIGLDALLPSRNVGITFTNVAFNGRMLWSAGWFNDWIETGESFSESSNHFVGRVTGTPIVELQGGNLLHVGVSGRYSDTRSGGVRFKTSPEAFFAPDFADTDLIPADNAFWLGLEASWNRGPVWITSEYVHTWVSSPTTGDPRFNGFHVSAGWNLTGENRVYNPAQGVFGRIVPKRKATDGGLGTWELVARYSRLDLDDASVLGGNLQRLSAGFSWYPTKDSRFEFNYGYVTLDRLDMIGHTHVFQFRLQLLML